MFSTGWNNATKLTMVNGGCIAIHWEVSRGVFSLERLDSLVLLWSPAKKVTPYSLYCQAKKVVFFKYLKMNGHFLNSFPKILNAKMPFLPQTWDFRVGRCIFEMLCWGDLIAACKLDMFVRTPVFCLCWVYITGPFQKDLESEVKAFESLCGSVVKLSSTLVWWACGNSVRLIKLNQFVENKEA